MPRSQWLLSCEWGGSWRSILLPPPWSGRKFNLPSVLAFVVPISVCFHPSSKSLLWFVYFFNPELSMLIPNGLRWDTRQRVPLKISLFLCLKYLKESMQHCCSPASAAGSKCNCGCLLQSLGLTTLCLWLLLFLLLSRSGSMTPSPLFKSALFMPYLWWVDLERAVDPVSCH